jgi:hypothetical protein
MKFISIKILSLILSASTSKSSNIDLGASELLDNSITIAKNKPLALRNLQLSMATLAASADSDANRLRNNGRYQRRAIARKGGEIKVTAQTLHANVDHAASRQPPFLCYPGLL